MGGRWHNSILLLKESFQVLKRHKQLLIFPVVSSIVCILLIGALAVPMVFLTGLSKGQTTNSAWYYIFFFVFYFIGSFIVIFFNTCLISCAKVSLDGGEPTFRDGMAAAFDNAGKISGWALVSATIGVVLAIISSKGEVLGQIVSRLIAVAWNLITFFVIPMIIFEGTGVFESIKNSGKLFKKTWGENLIARFSIGLIFGLLGLLGVIPIVGAALTKNAAIIVPVVAIVISYWAVLLVITAGLNGVLAVALYEYASTGSVPQDYTPEVIQSAFSPKPAKKRLGFGRK